MKVEERTVKAGENSEEYMLPHMIDGEESILAVDSLEDMGPREMREALISSMASTCKDTRRLSIALILATTWLSIIVSKETGYELKILEALVFGRQGYGVLDMIGTSLGRAIYSYFVASVLVPVIVGEMRAEWVATGFKKAKAVEFGNERNGISIATGIGGALVLYNFLAGRAEIDNAAIGLVCSLLLMRVFSNGRGLSKKMIEKVVAVALKGKSTTYFEVEMIVLGATIGFGLAVPISAMGISNSAYVLGALCVLGVAMYIGLERRGGSVK